MEHTVITAGTKLIAECLPDGGQVTDENSALDLVSICGEEGTDRILLHHTNLHPDFFDLKTRLAGNVLLKLSNYRIHTAAVIPPELIGTGRFYEFVIETNRRNDFRVFNNRDEAIQWLAGL